MGVERVEQIQQKQTKKGDNYLRVKLSRSGWASAFDTNVITTLQEGRDYDVELQTSGKYVHIKAAKEAQEVPTGAPAPAGLPDARGLEIRRLACAKIAGQVTAALITTGKLKMTDDDLATASKEHIASVIAETARRIEDALYCSVD